MSSTSTLGSTASTNLCGIVSVVDGASSSCLVLVYLYPPVLSIPASASAYALQCSPFSRVSRTYPTSTRRACSATAARPRRPLRLIRHAPLRGHRATSRRGRALAAGRASSGASVLRGASRVSSCRVADGRTVCLHRTSKVGGRRTESRSKVRWRVIGFAPVRSYGSSVDESLEARIKFSGGKDCIYALVGDHRVGKRLYSISRGLYRDH